jgi:hypothetical protein
MPAVGEKQSKKQSTRPMSRPAMAIAILAVGFWAIFTFILAYKSGTPDNVQWTRLAWVFGSVQSIAFAATGALFGTAVQGARADKADQRADNAEADANAQRDAAAKGRALAASLQADAKPEGLPEGQVPEGRLESAPSGAPNEDVAQKHALLARSLFGDLLS